MKIGIGCVLNYCLLLLLLLFELLIVCGGGEVMLMTVSELVVYDFMEGGIFGE